MTVYQVEPITIPAGDTIALELEFINSNGTIPDFSDYTAYYILSPYGFEDVNVLSKTMTLEDGTTNSFSVTLDSDDTIALDEGAYTAKIVLSDGSNYFKKARGVFNIVKDSSSMSIG